MKWRMIITDTERPTGVAPVCPDEENPGSDHNLGTVESPDYSRLDVFDCCPHPHIECWNEDVAREVCIGLTDANAEPAGT